MGALDDLRVAADGLIEARLRLDDALIAVGFRHQERSAVGALGADVVACAQHLLPMAVVDAHAAAMREIAILAPRASKISDIHERNRENTAHLRTELAAEDPAEVASYFQSLKDAHDAAIGPNARLLLSFKTAYFMVRALQDALYRVGLEVVEGSRSEYFRRASMNKAASSAHEDKKHPLRSLLGEFGDDYFRWFTAWRALRDSIKLGRQDGLLGPRPGGPNDDYGINLARVDEHGGIEIDLSRGTRISDVARALEMTTGLMIRITDAARARLSSNPHA